MSLREAFSPQEWVVLVGPLRLRVLPEHDAARAVSPRVLLQEQPCRALLSELGPVIGSPTPAITASLLVKRFAFLATGACLYAMSVCDKGLRLSLDNCLLEYGHDDGLWTSCMPVADQTPCVYPRGERAAWRAAVVQALFAGLLAPLLESLHQASGVSRRILWDNTAARVYSLYEKRMANHSDPRVRARVESDFEWLLTQAPPALFGLRYNPLQHFRRAPTALADGRCIRFRRTCCFYYQASNPVEYCAACPLLRPKKSLASGRP